MSPSVIAAPPGTSEAEASRDLRGLTEVEAAARLAKRKPFRSPPTSRTYASIVRANVFTIFNLILLFFGVITLTFGDWRDALFLGVLFSNSGIGIVQEVRAKRALDRLAALVVPTATVVRDGRPRPAQVEELVVDDLVRLAPGDQVVADGRLETSDVLSLDESILTGESRSDVWSAGQRRPRLSGSAVLALRFLLHAIEPRVVVGELVEVRQCDLAGRDRVVAGDVRR